MSPVAPKLGSAPPGLPRPGVSHVIFDFDGTLSWLRHGWPELMAGLFLKHVPLSNIDSRREVHDQLLSDILSLNGKSSIFQMEKCAERVQAERGARAGAQRNVGSIFRCLGKKYSGEKDGD